MVNPIISRFSAGGPPAPGQDLKILTGPLYSQADVQAAVDAGARIQPITRKCSNDVSKLGLITQPALSEVLLAAIFTGRYVGSEWCTTADDGAWAACDAYHLKRDEWNENAYKYLQCEYYVKFCIGKAGQVILLISCHPPEDKRRKR